MPTSLRAFLMLRTGGGDWAVEVFRALEDLIDAWKARAEPDLVTAIIHVGFDRPPSRKFDECAQRFPGKTLVTAAAKYALPSDFRTSRHSVGEASTLPLFLGTRGWGGLDIEEEEPAPSPAVPPTNRVAAGWIADFLLHRPEATDAFEASGIWDDQGYLDGEAELPVSLRHDAGLARFRHEIGAERGDPGAFARAAPPWLADREFESMDLPVRVSNVFINMQVTKVADLGSYSLDNLLSVRNFGRKSVDDLLDRLETALEEGPIKVPAQIENPDDLSLLAGIRLSLLNYKERERDIIRRRMGLDGPAETLQQIGDRYDVSRERIRQIEARTVRRLRQEGFLDLLPKKLSKLLQNREFPLPALGVEAADDWFVGMAEYHNVLRYILTNICDDRAGIVSIDSVDYLAFLNQERWESTQREARRLLESSVERRWSRSHCQLVVEGLLPESAREFRTLLWEKAISFCHFAIDGHGVEYLAAYGRGAEQIVEAVLEASAQPLHYTEIAALASARAGREIDVRRAHNAAAAVGLLLGRGIYGVERHVPLVREELGRLAEEAEEVVADGPPGRQWHASEILAMLVERGSQFSSIANKYVVDVALRQSGGLASLGRLVWTSGDEDVCNEVARIDIRQAVISLLRQAGRPLRARDLRQRLFAIRGVNEHFQIAAVDPLIRVATGLWGLNDRDIAVKRAEQPELIEAVVSLLRDREFALHASEIEGTSIAASGLSAATLFSLAAADPRMRVNGSQDLYLTEWGSPRRESISEAVPKILTTVKAGVRFGDLVELVEARIRRVCDRSAISACLQALEATLDETSGRWSLSANNVDEWTSEDESDAMAFALP